MPSVSGPSPSYAALRRPPWVRPVERFCKALSRAVLGARLYRADNPVQAAYLRETNEALNEILRQQATLTLQIRGRSLWWSSESVFEDDDVEAGLLVTLARHGVEQLSFLRGIEPPEVQSIVEVLATALSSDLGDVTTRMWCLDAPHFRYAVADPFDPLARPNRGLSPEHEQYRQLILHVAESAAVVEPPAEALAAWSAPAPLPWVEALNSELSERRAELSEQDALGPLMARASLLLLGALGAEAEPTAETPAWRLLSDLLRAVVCNGRFAEAQALLDRMDHYAQRASSQNVRRMVEGVRNWLGSADMVRPVMTIVEHTTEAAPLQAAVGYLLRLGPRADESLWRLTGLLRSDLARHHVADLLVRAAERDPETALNHLRDQGPAIIVELVTRAEQRTSASADLLWWFGLEHRESAIRAPATKLLRRRDGPVAEAMLLARLEDHDPQVRLAALDAVGRRPRQALLNRVQSYLKPDRLEHASEMELTMAMTAFTRIIGGRAVPQLAHLLNDGQRLRMGSKGLAVQVKAAQLLGALPDAAAVTALQGGQRTPNAKLRTVCRQALEGQYAELLNIESPPNVDLSPRPELLDRQGGLPPVDRSRSSGQPGRPLARGIVGLPSSSSSNPAQAGPGGGDG